MCKKCDELDAISKHYLTLANQITDQRALDGIERLIGECEDRKRELHPEPPRTA